MPLFEITTIDDISASKNDYLEEEKSSEEKRRRHSAKPIRAPYRLYKPQTAKSSRDNAGKKPDSDQPVARTDDQKKVKPEADIDETEAVSPRRHPSAASVIASDCLRKGYKIGKTIGSGAYAKVKLAEVLPYKLASSELLCSLVTEQKGPIHVAIKITEIKQVPKEFVRKFLPRELENHLPMLPHDNVVRVYDHFRTRERLYVVMQYCGKGDLLDLLNDTTNQHRHGLTEDVARGYFKQLLLGVKHVHDQGIVHRDIKCENILVDSSDCIKLADFGFCTRFHPDDTKMLKTTCGSWAYTAPEIARKFPYDGRQTDIWSLGIVLFTVTNGRLPFKSSHIKTLTEGRMGTLHFQEKLTVELMTLVRRILRLNPANRPSLDQILQDPWITGEKPKPHNLQRPKWNPLRALKKKVVEKEEKKEEKEENNVSMLLSKSGSRPPLLYRRSAQEPEPDTSVTVNHGKNETVILKSRTKNSRNIWTTGPTGKHQTRNECIAEGDNYNSNTVPDPASGCPRDTSGSNRNHPVITVDIILQQSARNQELVGHMGRRDISNNKVTKWLKDSDRYTRRIPLPWAPPIESGDRYQNEVPDGYRGCKVKVRVSAPPLTHKNVEINDGESESQMYDDLSSAYDSALPHSIQNQGELAAAAEQTNSLKSPPRSAVKQHQHGECITAHQRKMVKSPIRHRQNGKAIDVQQRYFAKSPSNTSIKHHQNGDHIQQQNLFKSPRKATTKHHRNRKSIPSQRRDLVKSPNSTIKHHQIGKSVVVQQCNFVKSTSGSTLNPHPQHAESIAVQQQESVNSPLISTIKDPLTGEIITLKQRKLVKHPLSPRIKYQHNISTVGLKTASVKMVPTEKASPPLFRKSVWTVPESHEMTSVRELVRLADIVTANGKQSEKNSLPFFKTRPSTSERHVINSPPAHHMTTTPAQRATCSQKQPISGWRSRRAASVNAKTYKRRNIALRQMYM